MADKAGRLSAEDMERIEAWLKDKGGNGRCPRCGHTEYLVNTHVMYIRSPAKTYFPAVLTHCLKCTFTSTFSANLIGVNLPTESEGDGDG